MGKRKQVDSPYLLNLGERVYQSRTKRKLSQAALADFVGVNRASICKWEQGLYDLPFTKVLELCSVLEINPKELV